MAAAAAAGRSPETYVGMFAGKILAAMYSIFIAQWLAVSAFAVEVTQPAGAAHGYPGLYDINGKNSRMPNSNNGWRATICTL